MWAVEASSAAMMSRAFSGLLGQEDELGSVTAVGPADVDVLYLAEVPAVHVVREVGVVTQPVDRALVPAIDVGRHEPVGQRRVVQVEVRGAVAGVGTFGALLAGHGDPHAGGETLGCLLYTSDAADDLLCVDLGGRRII